MLVLVRLVDAREPPDARPEDMDGYRIRPLAEDMQRRIAGSTLAVIEHSPHGTAVTSPAEFNRVVLAFHDRVDAGEGKVRTG